MPDRMTDIQERILEIVRELPADREQEVLDFAMFLRMQQAHQRPETTARPIRRLEELWGDFWPEGESVDDFIAAVREWRREDVELHKDLP